MCNEDTVSTRHCNEPTLLKERASSRLVNLKSLVNSSKEHLKMYQIPPTKCVEGLTSATKTPELLEKGILRAKYDLRVYKDGGVVTEATKSISAITQAKRARNSFRLVRNVSATHNTS